MTATESKRPRLPEWLRIKLPTSDSFSQTRNLLDELKLHTVCESAKCPNHWECWEKGTATFMIAGDRCTRACGFCAVATAKPLPLEADEPLRVAEATRRMKLKHVVITAVARDDMADGGAEHFRQTIEEVRRLNPKTVIEVLVPDFQDNDASIEAVLAANPQIFNHNLETIRRLTPDVRHRATYDRSLSVLKKVKTIARQRAAGILPADQTSSSASFAGELSGRSAGGTPAARSIYTKSGMMLGLGETEPEVLEAMRDLRAAGCDILTLGQYLQPSMKLLPVKEFITPEQFAKYKVCAEEMGFVHVASGPMVRSSYHADEFNAPSAHC